MAQVVVSNIYFQDFVPALLDFLRKKNIKTVEVEYFTLDTDSNQTESVRLDKLENKLDDFSSRMDDEILHFTISVEPIYCNFCYDGDNLIINFPDGEEEEMQVFRDLQE